MEPVLVERIEIEISADEVRRFVTRSGAKPPQKRERVERALVEALAAARGMMDARGIYVITAGRDLPGSTTFERFDRMAFCVSTIGPALEREVTALSERGEILRAVVLDAVGSVAAEAAAEEMDKRIAAEAAREGLRTSCRASPGYGDWNIREQGAIFRLLPAERIGVRLSETFMMIPRKSVSFAMQIAKEPERLRSEVSCRNCDREDCPYRLLD